MMASLSKCQGFTNCKVKLDLNKLFCSLPMYPEYPMLRTLLNIFVVFIFFISRLITDAKLHKRIELQGIICDF